MRLDGYGTARHGPGALAFHRFNIGADVVGADSAEGQFRRGAEAILYQAQQALGGRLGFAQCESCGSPGTLAKSEHTLLA